MNKGKIDKKQLMAWSKKNWKYILTAVIALFIGSASGPSSSDLASANQKTEDVEVKLAASESTNEELSEKNNELIYQKDELQAKVDEAAIWFKMTDEQKKKATDEVGTAEEKAKAEEQAKKEAEEKAKAEAEAKAKAEAEAEEKRKAEEEAKAQAEAEAAAKAEAEREAKEAAASMSQRQAIGTAEDYLDYTAFSRKGLIEQLEYEGFSNADATYAVDSIEVDWQEQAVKMAQNYLDYSTFSRSGLIEQLVYEGFSNDMASYAASQVGF